MTAVTPTDRLKSVRNHCLIKVVGGFLCSFLDFSVGEGTSVIGLSQISSLFSANKKEDNPIAFMFYLIFATLLCLITHQLRYIKINNILNNKRKVY